MYFNEQNCSVQFSSKIVIGHCPTLLYFLVDVTMNKVFVPEGQIF
jgi:hypothetical protein